MRGRQDHVVIVVSEAGAKPTSSIRRMGVDVQRRIDEHVRLVDAALAKRDVPAVERRGIELALRQKILEKLAARQRMPATGPDAPHDTADIDAILAELPAPEA